MIEDIFSLHSIVGSDNVTFPFPLKDYKRYVSGDDRLAHRFGTNLAKVYIHDSSPTDNYAVTVHLNLFLHPLTAFEATSSLTSIGIRSQTMRQSTQD
jgi:hypothetical protein